MQHKMTTVAANRAIEQIRIKTWLIIVGVVIVWHIIVDCVIEESKISKLTLHAMLQSWFS